MALYTLGTNKLQKIPKTSFADEKILERQVQRLLKEQIEVLGPDLLGPDLLIISEEFCQWQDSKRRIDLLAIDRDAKLVVIELKRNEDGSYMDLQAIRYAAMVSTLTFEKAVDIFSAFLAKNGKDEDAKEVLLDFLRWDEPDDDKFAVAVRIILVSADFGKELATSVMWINEHDLDITCIRMIPYKCDGKVIVNVEQLIPLPEAKDYIVGVKHKQQKVKVAQESQRDRTRFNICVGGKDYENVSKRQSMYLLITFLCSKGVLPEEIVKLTNYRPHHFFRRIEGEVTSEEFVKRLEDIDAQGVQKFDKIRYFCKDGELIHFGGNTYALLNQWGPRFYDVSRDIVEHYKDFEVSISTA